MMRTVSDISNGSSITAVVVGAYCIFVVVVVFVASATFVVIYVAVFTASVTSVVEAGCGGDGSDADEIVLLD